MTKDELVEAVEKQRKKMTEIGQQKGLKHPDTIKESQLLDKLLNQLQKSLKVKE